MGRFPDVQPTCITQVYRDIFFFDDTSDQILRYNPRAAAGSRVTVQFSAAAIDAAAGTDVTQCRDSDGAIAYTVFALSNAANQDLLVSFTPGATATLNRLVSGPIADGITGVAILNTIGFGRLFVAQSQFLGAPEDGIYVTQASGANQTLTPVVTNADLDLVGIDVALSGDVYATSSENGVGPYKNKIVRVVSPLSAPSLQIVLDPFAEPAPLFVNGDDGGLEDMFIGQQGNVERMFVMNNSFGGPQGETIGRFNLDGSSPTLVFTQADLIASPAAMATTTSAYSTPGGTGYLGSEADAFGQITDLYVASRNTNSGQTAIFKLDVRNLVTAGEQEAAEAAGFALALANPVRGTARVQVTQPEAADVRVSVVDALGREVAVLAEGTRGETFSATWSTAGLAPGVYHLLLRANGHALSRSVTVVR